MKILAGLPASEGIAIAPAFVYRPVVVAVTRRQVADVEAEETRLTFAIQSAMEQLTEVQAHAAATVGKDTADIFAAHRMFLEDPALLEPIQEQIRSGVNAEAAVAEGIDTFATMLSELEDEYLRERAADVRDVGQRLLRALAGVDERTLSALDSPAIIIAHDLAPSDTAQLNKELVRGFCTATGGMTSHTTILARLLGLPAVVGAGADALGLANGETVILDGMAGKLIASPDEATVESYRASRETWLAARESSKTAARRPAATRDGHQVEVVANIGDAESAQSAIDFGAEGVGLLRTEFLFLNRTTMPDEEEQYRAYRAVAEVMGSRPVVVRTLDIGGDKPLPYLDLGREDNPFLGWRAIRISLAQPEFFKIQLRAILRAGAGHNLKIMLPMIATRPEIRAARRIFQEAQQELEARGVDYARSLEFGIMVEIPAAAVAADLLAPEIDFFSIGTNDLTQYTLACDRGNTRVAALYDHLHPAVLRLIRTVIESAHRHGKWVGLCGEMGGDVEAIPILIGLDLDEFSMSPGSIPAAKELIRELDQAACRELAARALNVATPEEVRELVRQARQQAAEPFVSA